MKIALLQKRVLGTAIAVLCLTGVPLQLISQAQTPPPGPDNSNTAGPGALPPYILPTSPLAQVVRLAQAGVDESIIMTFVTNSGSTFNLDSDKIIYLKDVGLPNDVITAMMQRDVWLQQQMAAANQPPIQPAPAPPPVTTDQPDSTPPPPTTEPPAEITVNYFYDTLAPYGTWVDVDGYGRCWRPSVVAYNPGWQPYCDHGHWVYTDCGWYWYSDYSWGWAPFHYGRWFLNPHLGWCWAPDTIWGPSWVTWRYSDDYCGWAPLPPGAVYRTGIGFFYQGRNVAFGFDFGLVASCFTFVPTLHFCDPHPRRYCAPPAQATRIFSQTTVINNFNYRDHNFVNGGIAPEHITAVTRLPIHPVAIRDAISPAGRSLRGDQLSHDGRTLIANRPDFSSTPAAGENHNNRPAPSGFPVQSHFSQPNNNWPASQTRPVGQSQERNNFYVPNQTQRPSSSANYYSSPSPTVTPPNYNNRSSAPQGRQQLQSSGAPYNKTYNSEAPTAAPVPSQGQHNEPEASHYNAPVAAPAERPQHSQPSNQSSSAPASQNSDTQNQGSRGNGPKH